MATGSKRDTCLWCNFAIFKNTQGRWVHLVTGSAICPAANVATPRTTEPH